MKHSITAMMMLLLFIAGNVRAQSTTGNIKGNITTSDGQAAAFVSIQIKSTGRGTVTDAKGEFSLRKLEPGAYTLLVSLIGYEPKEETVQVTGGQTARINFHLQVSDRQLNEVTIKGSQNKLTNKESDFIARLPIKNLENPQVYNVVSKELMKEQVITSFDDALKNAPGVNRLWSSTGRPGDGAGYYSMRGFVVQPSMVNGVATITNSHVDPANIERIETIKGPSGTLFGSSLISFGGLINIVTKKPYDTFDGEISYTGGEYGLSRVTADVNTPLNKDHSVVLRTNAAYHYENSFQDAGFKKSFFLAPSLSYQVNDKLSFLVNAEFYNGESTNVTFFFLNRRRPFVAKTPAELGIDFTHSFTNNDLTYWTSQTNISRNTRKSNGYYTYMMFLDRTQPTPNDTLLSRFVSHQNSTSIATDIQQNFIGDFRIGTLRNRLVAGLDFLAQETSNDNLLYVLFDQLNATNNSDPRYLNLTRQAADAKLATAKGSDHVKNLTSSYTYSAYVSDVLNITDQLMAMASLRVDYFDNKGTKDYATNTRSDNYNQLAVSPKFGLIYQVVKDQVSVFANYMNGFQNVQPQTQPLPELNGNFKPQQANQWEGGVKLDAFQHKLSLTASYYDILVTNMTRGTSIEKDGKEYNYTIQDGTQKSKGVEWDITANPLPGFNIIAGYSYNDSKLLKAGASLEGRRPTSAGPANLANLWLSYTASSGKLHGLGIGFGGNYASENVIANDAVVGTFTLPSYTVLNASIFYNVKAYRLALKVDNLANKEYFGGWTTVERQQPRRISGSVAFKF